MTESPNAARMDSFGSRASRNSNERRTSASGSVESGSKRASSAVDTPTWNCLVEPRSVTVTRASQPPTATEHSTLISLILHSSATALWRFAHQRRLSVARSGAACGPTGRATATPVFVRDGGLRRQAASRGNDPAHRRTKHVAAIAGYES